jgi:pyridoxamine 5'-phosphate oxidase-like protein
VNELIKASPYMVLATADADGVPWASPVWFATDDGTTFIWVSDPNARHSRNIAARPQIAIVIFDSTVRPGDGAAVYMEARAEQTGGDGLDVFNRGCEAQGIPTWGVERITGPANRRLYRAVAGEQTMLGPGDARIPLA